MKSVRQAQFLSVAGACGALLLSIPPVLVGVVSVSTSKRIIYVFQNGALFLHWMMRIFETKISKKLEMKWIREKGKLKTKEAC